MIFRKKCKLINEECQNIFKILNKTLGKIDKDNSLEFSHRHKIVNTHDKWL